MSISELHDLAERLQKFIEAYKFDSAVLYALDKVRDQIWKLENAK